MKKRAGWKMILSFAIVCFLLISSTVFASDGYQVRTQSVVVDAADDHVIIKDGSGKYGLLNQDGEEVIPCEYDGMSFPEDTAEYDYMIVQKGDKQGILDYEGKELVDVRYDSITPYANDNTIAAGRDGVWTYLYDEKGKELGRLEGQYEVISDYFFKSDTDLKNDKDKQIFTFAENNLLSPGEEAAAHCLKIGKYIAADYYVPSDSAEREKVGDISVSQYVKIFDRDGNSYADVKPEETWTDEEEGVTASVRLEDVVSEHSLKVKIEINDEKDTYRIYDMEENTYSGKFRDIGTFTDGRAFALDEDKNLQIIDESGNVISEGALKIEGYSRQYEESGDKAYILFRKKEGDTDWKLLSLKTEKALPDTYEEIIFKEHQYVIVGNSDEKYGVMNREGDMVIPFGEYGKEVLTEGMYSDTCVCITDNSTSSKIIHFYPSSTQAEKKTLPLPVLIAIIAAVVVMAGIIIAVVVVCRMKKRKEEERREKEKREQARREAERRKWRQQKQRQPQSVYGQENVRIIHEDKGAVRPGGGRHGQAGAVSGFAGAVKIIRGEQAGKEMAIRPGQHIRVGRSREDNDLVVSSIKASRRHCIITCSSEKKGYYVRDLSSNGVYLAQGTRLPQNVDVPLPAGTVLFLGNEELALELK